MKNQLHFTTVLLSSLFIGGLSLADEKQPQSSQQDASAQHQGDKHQGDKHQGDEHQGKQHQQKGKQHRQSEQSSQKSDKDVNYRVAPSGWIRMAVDYNNDGWFDAIETIYTYDLEKARKSSRDRANRDAERSMARSRSSDDSMDTREGSKDQQSKASQKREALTGKILQLRSESLSGISDPVLIARIRTEQNWPAKVVLGPKSQLKKLNLAEGDQVTVSGRKGRINDKSMLLASSVKSSGQQVSVELPSSRGAKRVRAELLSTRTAEFRNHNGKFVIAKVRCSNGKEATVNLGAKSKVDQLELSEGDELKMIVRPAKVNGQSAMVADELMSGGKSVDVSPPAQIAKRDRQNSRRQAGNRNRASNSGKADSSSTNSSSTNSSSTNSSEKQAALGVAIGENDEGVVILGIHPDSPAADEDLRVGDTIVSINGNTVDSPQSLMQRIGDMRPNNKVQLKILREGDEQKMEIKLTSRSSLMSSLR